MADVANSNGTVRRVAAKAAGGGRPWLETDKTAAAKTIFKTVTRTMTKTV